MPRTTKSKAGQSKTNAQPRTRYLTSAEVADIWKIAVTSVTRAARRRKIYPRYFGIRPRWEESAILNAIV